MNQHQELGAIAGAIIDANIYMVLGTADETGHPWVSPVYYATAGYNKFYWVSSPDALHSRNIAVRPDITIVIFNSQAPIGTGQAVYMSAVAEQLTGSDLERGIDIFSRSSLKHSGREWKPEDVQAPRPYRLYQATASKHWILNPAASPDQRIQVTI